MLPSKYLLQSSHPSQIWLAVSQETDTHKVNKIGPVSEKESYKQYITQPFGSHQPICISMKKFIIFMETSQFVILSPVNKALLFPHKCRGVHLLVPIGV